MAGAVALLRSAYPDLEVDTIKAILMNTARDEGPAGDDNSYGWGFIDAFAAMLLATTGVPERTAPETQAIQLSCRPNPFSRQTILSFRWPDLGPASLAVYDPSGRRVRSLAAGILAPGEHQVVWDGRDDAGRPAPAGVYLYRLDAAGPLGQGKLLLSK